MNNHFYQNGVWTPKAKILCLSCHGPNFPDRHFNEKDWKMLQRPIPLQPENWITPCDRCNELCQMEKPIAFENNMVRQLRRQGIHAYMAQTGSMYHAVHIKKRNYQKEEVVDGIIPHYLMTYDFNGEGSYRLQDQEAKDIYVTEDPISMFKHCLNLKEYLEVINND